MRKKCQLCKSIFETQSRALYCPNCRGEANKLRVKKFREKHTANLSNKTAEQLRKTQIYLNIKTAFDEKIKTFTSKCEKVNKHFNDVQERTILLDYYNKMMDEGMTWSELYRASCATKSVFNDYLKAFMRKNLIDNKSGRFYFANVTGLDAMKVIHEDTLHMSTPQNLLQTMTCGYYFPGVNVEDLSDEEMEIIRETEQHFYKAQYALEAALQKIKMRRQQMVWMKFIDDSSIFILTRFFKWAEFISLKSLPYFIITNIIEGKEMPETNLHELLSHFKKVCDHACLRYLFSRKYPNHSEQMVERLEEQIHEDGRNTLQHAQAVFSELERIDYDFSNHMVVTNSLHNTTYLLNEGRDKKKMLENYGKKLIEWNSRQNTSDPAIEDEKISHHNSGGNHFFTENDFFCDDRDIFDLYKIPIDDLYANMNYLASIYSCPRLPDKLVSQDN
jgi:hypothetical protein